MTATRSRIIERWKAVWAFDIVANEYGSAMTEYVIVLGTVSMSVMIAVVALGPIIVNGYARARTIIVMPYP